MQDVLQTKWGKAIELENRVAEIIRQQEYFGWQFNRNLAEQHLEAVGQRTRVLDLQLRPGLPNRRDVFNPTEVPRPFRKDGQLLERVKNYMGESSNLIAGPFSKVGWSELNLDSDDQIKEYLLTIGWRPTEWNYNKDTGEQSSPKLTEDSYGSVKDGIGAAITERLVLKHRYGQLAGLIKAVRTDGRIPSRINTLGTNTGRVRHSIVVNIPRISSFYGKEMRECFTVPEGKILLGCDAVSLESRMLAHYLNDRATTKLILSCNFITIVWEAVKEFASIRDVAKTIFYGWLYGASSEKLGRIADLHPKGWSNKQLGEAIKALIIARVPALGRLIEGVQRASKRGYLFGLDGRKLYIRSVHSALNTLLQSGGAITMKKAMVIADDYRQECGLPFSQVTFQHDETQDEVQMDHEDAMASIRLLSIKEAGEYFKLNCPLEGDVKVGHNWSQNH